VRGELRTPWSFSRTRRLVLARLFGGCAHVSARRGIELISCVAQIALRDADDGRQRG